MKKEELIQEFAMERAIENIASNLAEKLKEYEETKKTSLKAEIMRLTEEREEVYSGNKKIIEKYSRKDSRK